jgi:putative flippase GtrA
MLAQFSKFAVVGAVNTLVGLLAIYAAKWFFLFDDVAANLTGYAIGLTVSFLLNKSWTFRHRGDFAKSAVRFAAVFAVAYPINLGAVMLLIEAFGVNSYIAQALGMPPYMIAFYLLSRWFAFRRKDADGGAIEGRSKKDRTAPLATLDRTNV